MNWCQNFVQQDIRYQCLCCLLYTSIMEKNPAIDATLPKRNKKKREILTAEMLMQAIETNSCYIVINKIIERVSVEAVSYTHLVITGRLAFTNSVFFCVRSISVKAFLIFSVR